MTKLLEEHSGPTPSLASLSEWMAIYRKALLEHGNTPAVTITSAIFQGRRGKHHRLLTEEQETKVALWVSTARSHCDAISLVHVSEASKSLFPSCGATAFSEKLTRNVLKRNGFAWRRVTSDSQSVVSPAVKPHKLQLFNARVAWIANTGFAVLDLSTRMKLMCYSTLALV